MRSFTVIGTIGLFKIVGLRLARIGGAVVAWGVLTEGQLVETGRKKQNSMF